MYPELKGKVALITGASKILAEVLLKSWLLKDLFHQALAKFGRIDIVVANAGIEMVDKPFTEYTENDFDKVFDLNVKGTTRKRINPEPKK